MYKLTITFNKTEYTPEFEYFDKQHLAVQFAKTAFRDGYVKEESGKLFIYPYFVIAKMTIEETADETDAGNRTHPVQHIA